MTDHRFGSVAEIIAFAIRREIEAAEGYAAIGAMATTPGLRELAADLRGQEESHQRLLEGLSGKALREMAPSFTPELHIVDDLADENPSADMSIQDMLIFAAKKESRAVELYESLARMAAAAGHEQVFRFLAGQEREHKLKLEAAYEGQFLQEN
jgi:rubrerythrin